MSRSIRSLITVVMDLLVVVAVVVAIRIVVEFFGTLAAQAWGKSLLSVTRYLVLPLGLAPIPTPYGGHFDVNAAATVLVLLAAEWALGIARRTS